MKVGSGYALNPITVHYENQDIILDYVTDPLLPIYRNRPIIQVGVTT